MDCRPEIIPTTRSTISFRCALAAPMTHPIYGPNLGAASSLNGIAEAKDRHARRVGVVPVQLDDVEGIRERRNASSGCARTARCRPRRRPPPRRRGCTSARAGAPRPPGFPQRGLINVRFAPIASEPSHRSDSTRCAISRRKQLQQTCIRGSQFILLPHQQSAENRA
jgi:hypothetical protein